MLKRIQQIISMLLIITMLLFNVAPAISYADNSDSSNVVEDIEIDSLIRKTVGGEEINPITGEVFKEEAEELTIAIYYESTDSNMNLYKACETRTGIEIDEVRYPLVDSVDGKKAFLVWNGALRAYNRYKVGKDIIANFDAKKDGHQIKIFFSDREPLIYKDKNYVERTTFPDGYNKDTKKWDYETNDGNTNDDNINDDNTSKISDDFKLDKVVVENNSTNDKVVFVVFERELETGEDSKIKSIVINGQEYKGEKTVSYYKPDGWKKSLELSEAASIAELKTPIEIEIVFTDDSKVTNVVNDGNTGNGNDEDNTPTGTLADQYQLVTTGVKEENYVCFAFEKEVDFKILDEVEKIKLNGTEYTTFDTTYYSGGGLSFHKSLAIDSKEAVTSYKGSETPKYKIIFTDGSVITNMTDDNDNGNSNGSDDNNSGNDDNSNLEIGTEGYAKDKAITKVSLNGKGQIVIETNFEVSFFDSGKFQKLKIGNKEFDISWAFDLVQGDKGIVLTGKDEEGENPDKYPNDYAKTINIDEKNIVLIFDDGSTLKRTVDPDANDEVVVTKLTYTVEYFKDDEKFDTVTGEVTEENAEIASVEDKCPEGYELDRASSTALPFTVTKDANVITVKYVKKAEDNTPTGKLADQYKLVTTGVKDDNYVCFAFENEVEFKILDEVEKIELNGTEYTTLDTTYYSGGGLSYHKSLAIDSKEAVTSYKGSETPKYKIVFTDGSVITNMTDDNDNGNSNGSDDNNSDNNDGLEIGTEGFAKDRAITKVSINQKGQVVIEMNKTFNYWGDAGKFQTLKVGPKSFDILWKFDATMGDDGIIITASEELNAYVKTINIDETNIVLMFTDGSTLKRTVNADSNDDEVEEKLTYTVEYFKDDEKFETVTGEVTEENAEIASVEDKCPEGYELDQASSTTLPFTVTKDANVITVKYVKKAEDNTPTGTLADQYQLVTTGVKEENYVCFAFEKEVEFKILDEVEKIELNGTEYTTFDTTYYSGGGLSFHKSLAIDSKEAVTSYKESETPQYKIIFTDGSVITNIEDSNNQGGGDDKPTGTLADQYQLVTTGVKDENYVCFAFEKEVDFKILDEVEKIKLNGTEYTTFDTTYYSGGGLSFHKSLAIDSKEAVTSYKESETPQYKIIFTDGSIITNIEDSNNQDGDTGNGNDTTTEKLADKYKLVKVDAKNPYGTAYIYFVFEKEVKYEIVTEIEKIIINDKEYSSKDEMGASFYSDNNFHSHKSLTLSNTEAYNSYVNSDSPTYKIVFTDGSIIENEESNNDDTVTSDDFGFAKDKKIVNLSVIQDVNDADVFKIKLNKELQSFDKKKVSKVQIGDVVFTEELTFSIDPTDSHAFWTRNADIIAEAKKVDLNTAKFVLTFTDNSRVYRNISFENEGLQLTDDLADGNYILSFKAYESNSNLTKESSLGTYFDERAKLVVANNKLKVFLLNTKFADMLYDFVVEKDGKYIKLEKNTETGLANTVEYSFEVDNLTDIQKVLVLPLDVSDMGKYDKYKKADLQFTKIKEGFTKYKIVEDEEALIAANAENLRSALIANDVDTNKDGEISVEELQKATGKQAEVFNGHGKMANVLDLEGCKISDISILKDLGPNVKVLNLASNKLRDLPKDIFKNATGLTHIILNGNQLTKLDKDVFKYNTNLKFVSTDGNDLGDIPEGLFDNNIKLTEVSFMSSGVRTVPENLFKNNTRLKELYLQENNIKNLGDNFFETQTKRASLKRVELAMNKLEALPTSLGNLLGVKRIDASFNNIKEIPDSFENLITLKLLNLENNKIESVPTKLILNMIKSAKEGSSDGVKLDLSLNNIRTLPFAEIKSLVNNQEAGTLSKFDVDKNLLPIELTDEEKEIYQTVGIDFKDNDTTYFPQKLNAEAKMKAAASTIELDQRFDILELYYWELGDSAYYGGTDSFESADDFEKYLLGKGRSFNDVSNSEDRANAIVKILNKKKAQWKVQTVITKNDGTVVYDNTSDLNSKEGLKHEFTDITMRKGDEYTVTKKLYVKNGVLGWITQFKYSTTCTARESADIQNNEVQEIGVQLVKENSDETTMASSIVNPIAKLEKQNDKFIYFIQTKPFGTTKIELDSISIIYNGETKVVEYKEISTGDYTREYTFELNEKVERINCEFKIPGMGSKKGDFVFDYTQSEPESNKIEKTVKAYVLTTDKKSLSMANDSLVHDVKLVKAKSDTEYTVTVKFNEMTMKNITSGVESLSVKMDNQYVDCTKVEKGIFTFKLPEAMVTKEDTFIELKMTLYPEIKGHKPVEEALLVLDWNGDFKESDYTNNDENSGNNNSGNDDAANNSNMVENQKYEVTVSLLDRELNTSMGDGAFNNNRTAYVVKNGDTYTFTVMTNPIEMGATVGGLTEITGIDQDILAITQTPMKSGDLNYIGKFVFTTKNLKERYKVSMLAVPMTKSQTAFLSFDIQNMKKTNVINDTNTNTSTSDNVEVINSGEVPKSGLLKGESIVVKPEVKNGVATVELDNALANKAVENIIKDNFKNELVINAEMKENADSLTIKINKEIINKLAKKESKTLKIKSNNADVILSTKALDDMQAGKGSDIAIAVNKTEKGTHITIKSNSQLVPMNQNILVAIKDKEFTNNNGVVAIVDKDGNKKIIKKSLVEDGKAFAQLGNDSVITVIDNHKKYNDVTSDDWFNSSVEFTSSREIFTGMNEKEFAPNEVMTRGMFVTVLSRIEDGKPANKSEFRDIDDSKYYADAVAWASEHKIINGYHHHFNPNGEITREALATMLYRYMNPRSTKSNEASTFDDVNKISDWAKDAMNWAVKNGILQGYNNKLEPKKNATRAEVAAVIERIIKMQLNK